MIRRIGADMLTQESMKIEHHNLEFETCGCLEFLDCTDQLDSLLQQSGINAGFMSIHSKHTTAALLINENEPLLLNDMKRTLEKLAPQQETYLHNDFSIRTVNMQDKEDRNGHSHCKAIFLPTSQVLNIVDNRLDLGKWQRIFLLELDQAKTRTISVTILGSL
jgi:secondary thiamine-phosphate synthase enzyme